jgi:hypothetical protein
MCDVKHSRVSRPQNIDALFFMLMWARYGFHKKLLGHVTSNFHFLHPVGSAGHIVHSGAFGSQNIGALFFMLGWAQCSFHKSELGHLTPNLCFCIQLNLRVM